MVSSSYEFDCNVAALKTQSASRRASSLSKDRVHYQKRQQESCSRRTASAAPRGSDFSTPHRTARAASRSLLAQGAIAAGADMPQISMGCAGTWERWIRKPSVSKPGKASIDDFDIHEGFFAPTISKGMNNCSDAANDDWACKGIENISFATFNVSLDDQTAFPALPLHHSTQRMPKQAEQISAEEFSTPEKVSQAIVDGVPPKTATEDEMEKDWVVVSSDDTGKTESAGRIMAREAFDVRHPRNAFAKKASTKRAMDKDFSEGAGIDWSQGGMPTSLIRRLIHGTANAAHRAPHVEEKSSFLLPMHILRAQNHGSSKRERSTPKTPRSQSKPRTVKRTSSRC